jgi:hypothetical protein
MADERASMPPGDDHRRPDGVDDDTVAALGKLGEALEYVERARGSLYAFHQLSGRADLLLGEAADALQEAGHAGEAARLREDVVGRNVIEGRWTFQIVEDYDDTYYAAVRDAEAGARTRLVGGLRHLFEAEMKERRRSHGHRHHESRPG